MGRKLLIWLDFVVNLILEFFGVLGVLVKNYRIMVYNFTE